jgi:putative ABC transport system permease protein
VEHAALAITTPFRFSIPGGIRVPGLDSLPPIPTGGPYRNGVTTEYFTTMGTRILQGRDFATADDDAKAPRVVILGHTLALRAFPSRSPIGACVRVYRADSIPCATVVGVVEDLHQDALEEEPTYQFYIPISQWLGMHSTVLMARTRRTASSVDISSLRSALQAEASWIRFPMVRPLAELVDPQLRAWKLGARAFSILGALAFVVAFVGLYGVMIYNVQQRRFELGVRSAIGASATSNAWLVLKDALILVGLGATIGVCTAAVVAPRIRELLFHISPTDPTVFCAVFLSTLLVGLVATAIPARRAARTDPMSVLRST